MTMIKSVFEDATHTGSRIEKDMLSNTDVLVELKSQVAELRDYLIGTRPVAGSASVTGTQPAGFFGRITEINCDQRQMVGEIQDMVLELRNYF